MAWSRRGRRDRPNLVHGVRVDAAFEHRVQYVEAQYLELAVEIGRNVDGKFAAERLGDDGDQPVGLGADAVEGLLQ
jgi:hypothetical protein